MKQGKQQSAKWSPPSQALCLPYHLSLPHQWTDWTLALRGKFERSWLRRPDLDLTLLQPRGPLCLHYHRWPTGNWILSTDIHLAVGPLLERSFWRGAARGAELIHSDRAAGSVLGRREAERRDAMTAGLVPQLFPAQTLPHSGHLLSASGMAVDATAPIARVFGRSKRRQGDGGEKDFAGTSRVMQQDGLVLRVARRHVRIEETAHRTLVSASPPAANTARDVERRDTVVEAAPVSPIGVKGRLGMDRFDFDLEHLTDRVVRRLDDRLTAHKERLGRLF